MSSLTAKVSWCGQHATWNFFFPERTVSYQEFLDQMEHLTLEDVTLDSRSNPFCTDLVVCAFKVILQDLAVCGAIIRYFWWCRACRKIFLYTNFKQVHISLFSRDNGHSRCAYSNLWKMEIVWGYIWTTAPILKQLSKQLMSTPGTWPG